MKRTTFHHKISWSLLAVLIASPLASAHADVTVSGNSQLKGGMQINAPATLNVQGQTTISGNITVRQPITIIPDQAAQGNAFAQAGFHLIPSLPNLPINLGGIATGIVTVGNANVGQITGADGVRQIQPGPGVPDDQVTLDGPEIQQAKQALQTVLTDTDALLDAAAAIQANYLTEGGDANAAVYTEVTQASDNVRTAQTAGEQVINRGNVTKPQVDAARDELETALDTLEAKVSQLEIAAQALKDYVAALTQAKQELTQAIASADASEAAKALEDYAAAQGDTSQAVYTNVTAAIQHLNEQKAAGQQMQNNNTATLQQVQEATAAIIDAKASLADKKQALEQATQQLTAFTQAKQALSNAIASADTTTAQTALDEYEAAQGNSSLPVYTHVADAIQTLSEAKAAGNTLLASPSPALAAIQSATLAIQQAQSDLNSKVDALNAATDELKRSEAQTALQAALDTVNDAVTEAQAAQTAYTDKGGDPGDAVYTAVASAIANLEEAMFEAEALDADAASLVELQSATQSIQQAHAALDSQVHDLQTATDNLVLQEVVSRRITQFDFSTHYAGQARLTSKPITSTDFASHPKHFTVSDGNVTINVDLTWNIPLNGFTTGQVVGSAVDSFIQQYYNDHGIPLGQRTIAGIGFGDTFSVTRFQPGASNVVTVGGNDWNDFFDQQSAHGTDTDTSKNRSFTISDGSRTATIELSWNLQNMDNLVAVINQSLQDNGLQVTVQKVDATQFKLVAKKANITITTGGANKWDFFE